MTHPDDLYKSEFEEQKKKLDIYVGLEWEELTPEQQNQFKEEQDKFYDEIKGISGITAEYKTKLESNDKISKDHTNELFEITEKYKKMMEELPERKVELAKK